MAISSGSSSSHPVHGARLAARDCEVISPALDHRTGKAAELSVLALVDVIIAVIGRSAIGRLELGEMAGGARACLPNVGIFARMSKSRRPKCLWSSLWKNKTLVVTLA